MCPVSRATTRIAKEILRYTKKNPEAADTAEGIALWWLHSKYPLAEVKEALDHLVSQSLLVLVWRRESQRIYRSAEGKEAR